MKEDQELFLEEERVYEGNLILVNADFPIHKSAYKNMICRPVNRNFPDIMMEKHAAEILRMIFEDINAGSQIIPVSGCRSAREQTKIYENSKKENGEIFTKKFVALPYCSEHQTGFAIDLGLKKEEIDFICPDFPYEGVCQKFREAAPSYGFVERYVKGKEKVTGISAEPWHFRYVGRPHAKIMEENGWVLEEYLSFLRNFDRDHPYVFCKKEFLGEIYFVPAEKGMTKICIPQKIKQYRKSSSSRCAQFEISGNNVDGFIVTVLRN